MKTVKKQKLYDEFNEIFKKQLGLDLSEVLELKNGSFILKMELLSISMASMSLDLTKDEHGDMADFIESIQNDTGGVEVFIEGSA